VKSIRNVLHWPILVTLLLLSSGCSFLNWNSVKPIEVKTTEVERVKLDLDIPDPLKAQGVEWIILTPDNYEAIFAQLKKDNKSLVLFAVTSEGYEKLAIDMANIRNYIAQQRLIIIKYQDYYEPKPKDDSK
jgi:hypothetical protein